MKFKDIFERDINRKIEPVIVTGGDYKIETQTQMIQEYVLTQKLETVYKTILSNYIGDSIAVAETFDAGPGIWMKAFFGAGKSHTIWILKNLFEGNTVGSINIRDYLHNDKVKDKGLLRCIKGLAKYKTIAISFDVSVERKIAIAEPFSNLTLKVIHRELTARGYKLEAVHWMEKIIERAKTEGWWADYYKTLGGDKGWEKKDSMTQEILLEEGFIKHSKVMNDPQLIKDVFDLTKRNCACSPAEAALIIRKWIKTNGIDRIVILADEILAAFRSDSDKDDFKGFIQSLIPDGSNDIWLIVAGQKSQNDVMPRIQELNSRFKREIELPHEDMIEVVKERILNKKNDKSIQAAIDSIFQNNKDSIKWTNVSPDSTKSQEISQNDFTICYPFLPTRLEIIKKLVEEDDGGTHRNIIKGVKETIIKQSAQETGKLISIDQIFDCNETLISQEIRETIKQIPSLFDIANKELALRISKIIGLFSHIRKAITEDTIAKGLMFDFITKHNADEIKDILTVMLRQDIIGPASPSGYLMLTSEMREVKIEISKIRISEPTINEESLKICLNILQLGKQKLEFSWESARRSIKIKINDECKGQGIVCLTTCIPDDEPAINKFRDTIKNLNDTYFIIPKVEKHLLADIEKYLKIGEYLKKKSAVLSPEISQRLRKEESDLKSSIENCVKNAYTQGTLFYKGTEYNYSSGDALADRLEKISIKSFENVITDACPVQIANLEETVRKYIFVDNFPKAFSEELQKLNVAGVNQLKESGYTDKIFDMIKQGRDEKATGAVIIDKFSAIPYDWNNDVIRILIAVLLRIGKISAIINGDPVISYKEIEIDKLFKNRDIKQFKDAEYAVGAEIDAGELLKAQGNIKKLFQKTVTTQQSEILEKIKIEINSIMSKLDDIIPQCKNFNFLKWSECLKQYKDKLREIILLKKPVLIIKKLNEYCVGENNLIDLEKNAGRIIDFFSEGNLTTLEKIKYFLEHEYKDISNISATDSEYKTTSENFINKIIEVENKICDETKILEDWEAIEREFKNSQKMYLEIYRSQHSKTTSAYTTLKNRIEGLEIFNKIKRHQDKENLLKKIEDKICISLEMKDKTYCVKCSASLRHLFDGEKKIKEFEDSLIDDINKIIKEQQGPKPEDKTTDIVINELINSEFSISTMQELDLFLNEIRQRIKGFITSGKKVRIKKN